MIDLLGPVNLAAEIPRLALVFLRVGGLVAFAPILGAELLPVRFRILLALALSAVLLPTTPAVVAPPASSLFWVVAGVRELSVGLVLGMAARTLFTGIEGAAALLAGPTGYAMAGMIDPLTGDPGSAPTTFQSILGTALFLSADLHHLFISGLHGSYALLPPAAVLPAAAGMKDGVVRLGLGLFVVTVKLAAPALLVTFAVDLVLGLVGRALPQVQILTVGYPVKMAFGLVSIGLLALSTGAAMGWMGRTFAADAARLVGALAGK